MNDDAERIDPVLAVDPPAHQTRATGSTMGNVIAIFVCLLFVVPTAALTASVSWHLAVHLWAWASF